MSKLTEEQKESGNRFAKTLGNIAWNSTALVMVLLLVAILLFSVVGVFVFFNVAGEAEELYQAEVQERSYEDIEYLPAEGELCYDGEYYIDLTDLDVKQLAYEHTTFGYGSSFFYYNDGRVLSTIDDLKAPDEIYTLHYDVWRGRRSQKALDKKEARLKKEYGGEAVAVTLDYGAAEAYWLGDELFLRYDEGYLFQFYSDTTRELLESQTCADFMRTQMRLPEIEEETLLDYFF